MPKTKRSKEDVRTRGFAPSSKRPGNEPKTFMSTFNPNEASRSDFNKFRENLKQQGIQTLLDSPKAGSYFVKTRNFNPQGAEIDPVSGQRFDFVPSNAFTGQGKQVLDQIYTEPYQEMMGNFLETNPQKYKELFPVSYFFQRGIPSLAGMAMGAVTGIPGVGPMIQNMLPEKQDMTGNFNYLDYTPNRLPKINFKSPDSSGVMGQYYRQFYPLDLPEFFYQFMDDEVLPYKTMEGML